MSGLPNELIGPGISNNYTRTTHTLPDSTNIFYSNNRDTLRCPEGYIFENSNLLYDDYTSIIKYNSVTNKWKDKNGQDIDSIPREWIDNTATNGLRCKRKYCEPLGPVNSKQEYDVVVDDLSDSSKEIECNDGYVFDTTDTKLGKVKCGAIPIMNASGFDKENEVAWLADTRRLELFCEGITTENLCNTTDLPVNISNNEDELYDYNGKILNCTWIPAIADNDSGFTRSTGECKFIHRADLNQNEPICRGMYCDSKEIPDSNRTNTGSGPLPGPESGSIHGDCINFDGQIIDNITNSSDCNCYRHKSCDICTSDDNCQWCGSSENGGGFCYSTKTHLGICDTSIRHDRGGSCIHTKTGRLKENEPEEGWTEDTCVSQVCVKESHWNALNEINYQSDKNNPEFYKDSATQGDCYYDNKQWDDSALITNVNACIVKNNKLDNIVSGSENIEYYPIKRVGDTVVKLNISDKICVPNFGTTGNLADNINTCDQLNETDCENSQECIYKDNTLRDSIFEWSEVGKHIEFNNSENCPIIKSPGSTDLESNKFSIQYHNNGYIELLYSQLDTPKLDSDYLEQCAIINPTKEKNIVSGNTCGLLGGPNTVEIHNCEEPNTKYCTADTIVTTSTGEMMPACPETSRVTINGINVPGCLYYDTLADIPNPDGYYCYGDTNYSCSAEDTEYYNCEKTLIPDSNSDRIWHMCQYWISSYR